MGINGKPLPLSTQLLDATLVFRLQFFFLIQIFVYLGESCVILVHVQNKLQGDANLVFELPAALTLV